MAENISYLSESRYECSVCYTPMNPKLGILTPRVRAFELAIIIIKAIIMAISESLKRFELFTDVI